MSERFPGVDLSIASLITDPTVHNISVATMEAFRTRSISRPAPLLRSRGSLPSRGTACIYAIASANAPYCMKQQQLALDAPLFYRNQVNIVGVACYL
jgi:hypothetical protein